MNLLGRARRAGQGIPGRWLAAGGGLVLAAVVGVAVLVQTTSGAACAASLPAGGVLPAAAPPTGDAVHRGKATYYSTSGGGNCSYQGPPADGLFVALSPAEYAGAAACGGYLDVTGPKGKVRVKIVDLCPGCPVGTIDLSKKAFARIADLGQGVVPVKYRAAINPRLPGPLSFRFKDGTSQWWFAVLVNNHGNPLRSMLVRPAGGQWHKAARADYNYWLVDDGLGRGPFDIRITDVYGQRVTATGVRLVPEREQRTKVLLYGGSAPAGSTPSPTATPAATATATAAAPATTTPATPGPTTPAASPTSDDC